MWGMGRRVRGHVKGYKEGRRLMRQGGGADEWLGMEIVREHLMALVVLGYDEHGEKATLDERRDVLTRHGLRVAAMGLKR